MEGVGEVLAGDQRTLKLNEQGKWHAVGHAVPHQLRVAVIDRERKLMVIEILDNILYSGYCAITPP